MVETGKKEHGDAEQDAMMAKKGGNADWMNKLTDTVTGKKDGQTGGSRRRMRKGKSGKTLRRKKMTMKQRQQQQRQQRQQQQRQRRRH